MLKRWIFHRRFRILIASFAVIIWLCGLGANNALAADNVLYSITNISPFNVYTVNTSTGVATSVGNLSFASAAIARQPSTGLIYYYAFNATGGVYQVATWNPATGTNTTLSATVAVYLPRLAFRSDGVLYGMDSNNVLYTLNTATGAIASTVGTVTGGGLGTGFGGDMGFSPTGTLYLAANTNLYTISGTTATLVGATGVATAIAGLAFATDGLLYASETTAGSSRIYTLSTTTGLGTLVGSSGAVLTDLGNLPAFADLAMTKTATSGFQYDQNSSKTATYSLSVKNNGPQSASGPITVTDTIPTGLTYVSATGSGWSCILAGSVVTCTNAGPVANGVTMSAVTLTVTVGSSAVPSVTNSASVSSTTFDQTASNNSSSITTNVTRVDLQKSVSGSPIPGTDLTYTVTFTNKGGASVNFSSLSDPNPLSGLKINTNMYFKVGSVSSNLTTTGLTLSSVKYSNDGGTTWTYTPASGAGGAPAGYDGNVTNVQWNFTGSLSQTAPNNTGSVSFVARIK
jgi:uncharacterized repeat protein (TIGR01451 family)